MQSSSCDTLISLHAYSNNSEDNESVYHERSAVVLDVASSNVPLVPVQPTVAEISVLSVIFIINKT